MATFHTCLPVRASSATRFASLIVDEQLVVVERDAAHRDIAAKAVLPDQIAGLAVERLDDAAGVVQEDRAVVGERRRLLVPPSFIGQTHASCRSCALSRVICVSGLKFEA